MMGAESKKTTLSSSEVLDRGRHFLWSTGHLPARCCSSYGSPVGYIRPEPNHWVFDDVITEDGHES